jgi:hypothetical protein
MKRMPGNSKLRLAIGHRRWVAAAMALIGGILLGIGTQREASAAPVDDRAGYKCNFFSDYCSRGAASHCRVYCSTNTGCDCMHYDQE